MNFDYFMAYNFKIRGVGAYKGMGCYLNEYGNRSNNVVLLWQLQLGIAMRICFSDSNRSYRALLGVTQIRFGRGVPLEPRNSYPSLRIILAEKVPIFRDFHEI